MADTRPLLLRGKPVGAGTGPVIITPLVGRTPAAIDAELQAILPKRPDMLEWRVDHFDGIADSALVVETARAIQRAAAPLPLLLTRRSSREGGQPIAIDEAGVVALLGRVCEAQCADLIDCEMSGAVPDLAQLRAVSAAQGVAMVLSFHDFQRTPDIDSLVAKFTLAASLGADVAKVAVMPQNPQDVLTLLSATWRASQCLAVPLISMSMGGLGAMSRIVGWQYGSAATFAVGQGRSAPGQMAVEDLRAALALLQAATQGHLMPAADAR